MNLPRSTRVLTLCVSAVFSTAWLLWLWENPSGTFNGNHDVCTHMQTTVDHAATVAFAIGRVLLTALGLEWMQRTSDESAANGRR